MTGTTRILLIRHGQSEWNLLGRWQGQADPPLTDLGRAQARSASRRLGALDAIWSSDLQRAAETATIISAELGVGPVVLDEDLRERHAGEWQGLTRDEIEEQYPGWLSPPDGSRPRRPPSWEPDEDLAARVHRTLRRIHDAVGPGEVLAVAHAGLLYTVERELGADGSRLGNLEGRWLDLLDDHGTLARSARLGDRVTLLDPDELTVPNQI
jgi:broad specificity phosphatase PhoE